MEKGKIFITDFSINLNTNDENDTLTHSEIMALKETDPKKYFSVRLYPLFESYAENSERDTKKEIEGEKETRGEQLWIEWLKVEIEKCSSNGDLRAYRNVMKRNTPTPKAAVDYFTNLIYFDNDGKQIDWLYHFDMAAHISMNWQVEKAENWLYKGVFSIYRNAARIEARQKTLSAYLSDALNLQKDTPSKQRGRPQSQAYVFENLFIKDKLASLLTAALRVGLIEKREGNYFWVEVAGMKGHHINAFWTVAKECGMIKKGFKNKHKIAEAIKLFFNMKTLAKNTLDAQNPHHQEYKQMVRDLKKELS